MAVKYREFKFHSHADKLEIHAMTVAPEGKIIGVVQILHGMCEHKERYYDFMKYLAEKGYLCVIHDHRGHGSSVVSDADLGYFYDAGYDGLIEDAHQVTEMIKESVGDVPYILLGHSMGSFITRNYLFRYGTGIQGAIICGTGSQPGVVVKFSRALAAFQGLLLGEKHTAKLIDKLAFGNYNKQVEKQRTSFDWLCRDEAVVDAYIADELCGFTFTVNGFRTLFTLLDRLNKEENLKKMPETLPVLFIAGEKDPVGNYGEGVKKAFRDFQKAGLTTLSMKLYPEDRHELLNELDKEKVYEDIYSWMLERIKEYQL